MKFNYTIILALFQITLVYCNDDNKTVKVSIIAINFINSSFLLFTSMTGRSNKTDLKLIDGLCRTHRGRMTFYQNF